ncbi:MAG: hypothetical protein MUF31_18740 [Akkermansiaceae bacterium]|nr:hypothetical protein [Akkermansiaceae bacterium]
MLNGRCGVESEIDLGVGWQDPAVIRESGLCVWRSGHTPVLDFKQSGDFLVGRMAILWTGIQHDTPGVVDFPRDYDGIERSGHVAREAVLASDIHRLAEAVSIYHGTQLAEGMEALPDIAGAISRKYCGGGYGGYGLYLFESESARSQALVQHDKLRPIEPHCR